MYWITIAYKSLKNRKLTVALTLFMIAMSVSLLLTVERIRLDTRSSFSNTLTGADLVIGARTGSLNLLLYSVFRIGNPTNNIDWHSYLDLKNSKEVAWTIPISLGDSHRGYRVIGTNRSYYEHYQYGRRNHLSIARGKWFENEIEVVLGAEVADKLEYKIGDSVILAHGTGSTSFEKHSDSPFIVSGILAATGTPIDRSLHVALEGITALHLNWQSGAKSISALRHAKRKENHDLTPTSITAIIVGLNSRLDVFSLQRHVNQFKAEPLMAILPGAALQELWSLISVAERALFAVTILVMINGLIGMLAVILASLNERRREIAIYRALGSTRNRILLLLVFESGFYGIAGLILGYALHVFLILFIQQFIHQSYGIELTIGWPEQYMVLVLLVFAFSSCVLGLVPGYRAYTQTLTDGLTARL